VWHNEIIYIIEKGIKAFGSSAAGAIRAVELEKFGMIGIGKVYDFFKNKLISSDEEVICLFDAKNDFYRITEPLINIRFTLEQLNIDKKTSEKILKIVKSIYWKNRTREKIASELKSENINDKIIKKLFDEYIDAQMSDAKYMLDFIEREYEFRKNEAHESEEISDGNLFHIMYERDRKVKNIIGETSLNNIANYALINHPQSEDIIFNSLNREIVTFIAGNINIEADKKDIEIEIERLKKKFNIKDLDEWIKENDIDKKDFYILMKSNALCRKMHRWLIGNRKYRRNTSIINGELILRNEYIEYKDKSINMEKDISERKLKEKFNSMSLEKLAALKMKRDKFPWNVNPFQGANESGMSKNDFKLQLLKEELLFEEGSNKISKFFGN